MSGRMHVTKVLCAFFFLSEKSHCGGICHNLDLGVQHQCLTVAEKYKHTEKLLEVD